MPEDKIQEFEIINIKAVAKNAGLPYTKVRNCIKGVYNSLTDSERTRLYNAMHEGVSRAAAVLGFSYEGRRIKAKD